MIFFSPVDMGRENFFWKLSQFLKNPNEERFLIFLAETDLGKFKERLCKENEEFFETNDLKLVFTSKSCIDGISSALYMFQKSNTG